MSVGALMQCLDIPNHNFSREKLWCDCKSPHFRDYHLSENYYKFPPDYCDNLLADICVSTLALMSLALM